MYSNIEVVKYVVVLLYIEQPESSSPSKKSRLDVTGTHIQVFMLFHYKNYFMFCHT